jgi:hypothetical protein
MSYVDLFEFIPYEYRDGIENRTSSVDLTLYMQQWADVLVDKKLTGFMRPGVYNIHDIVWLTKDPFDSIRIKGSGRGYRDTDSQTTIFSYHKTRPALAVQYGRGVYLEDFSLIGPNDAPSLLTSPTDDPLDYHTAGMAFSRYAPNAGIAIDPAAGTAPIDGYSGLTYSGTNGGSAEVYLNNIGIFDFSVGFSQAPNATSNQGDGMFLNNCLIERCDIGASFGQSQSRGCHILGGGINKCRTAVTSNQHGQQAGSAPSLSNLQMNTNYRLFDYTSSYDRVRLENIYGENIRSIGRYGSGWATILLPLVIDSCHLALHTDTVNNDTYLIESHGPCKISGSYIHDKLAQDNITIKHTSMMSMDTCTIRGDWDNNDINTVMDLEGNKPLKIYNTRLIGSSITTPVDIEEQTIY